MPTRRRSPPAAARKARPPTSGRRPSRHELSLLHDLHVYKEEVVAQNEDLQHALRALEETRDQFVALYEFAPNGYLTLNREGLVLRVNLTGAAMFGRRRQAIEGTPLLALVSRNGRRAFLEFLRRCRLCRDGSQVEGELAISSADGIRIVQCLCRPRLSSVLKKREFFVAMVDVTDRQRLEVEQSRAASDHASLTSRLLTIQDDERRRIARDLHDDAGQEVTALRLKLDVIAASCDDGVRMSLQELRQMLEKLDSRLHLIATELRPASLDLGVVAAIQQYVQRWSATLGVPAEFHASGLDGVHLRPDVETHLYRIAQEALHNVQKHANASRAVVLLERRRNDVVLIVEDNGRGFRRKRSGDPQSGLGLVGMRERAQIIGGRLEVESSRGRGTTVFLHVPDLAAGAFPEAHRLERGKGRDN